MAAVDSCVPGSWLCILLSYCATGGRFEEWMLTLQKNFGNWIANSQGRCGSGCSMRNHPLAHVASAGIPRETTSTSVIITLKASKTTLNFSQIL